MSDHDLRLLNVTWRPPVVETGRLVLRGWEVRDAEPVFEYASDPEVSRYMSWDSHRDRADTDAFLNGVVARNYSLRELDYALCHRDSPDVPIGGLGVYWRDKEHGVMELGYVLRREYWGRGFVPEAGRALVVRAFETTEAMRIFAPIFAENARSQRAAEKMGMKLDGVLRSAKLCKGRRRDMAIYSILRGE
jgi:ribosomal-protein-alanine N-acetyltransferase